MNDKKTASDVATIESGKGKRCSGTAYTVPEKDYITSQHKPQAIERLLDRGEANALTTDEIMTATGIQTTRQVRAQVAKERAAGALILSSEKGYFLPSEGLRGREEMERFVSLVYSKALSTMKAATTVRTALLVLEGQIPIE